MDYDERFREMTQDMDDPDTPEESMLRLMTFQQAHLVQRIETIKFARSCAAILFIGLAIPVIAVAWVVAIRYLF